VHDPAAGLAVDQTDMADVGVRGQRRGDGVGVGGRIVRHGQQHRDAAGLARQTDHAVGIGSCGGDQQLLADRNEGADGRLGDEVAAALQWQRRMLAGDAAGDVQHTLANSRVERTEVIVPGGEVVAQGLAHLGAGGDRAGDQQQHTAHLGQTNAQACHGAGRKSRRCRPVARSFDGSEAAVDDRLTC
jgi:hypothetical protein